MGDALTTRIGGTAVVLGASVAGLCAARVLSERFDEVVVVDRDALPDGPKWRKQVPQGRQPHLLLVAGARILEGWFPGIIDELEAAGAVDLDLCADLFWYQGGGVFRRPQSPLRGPAMSRPLLEHTVRSRVEALGNVAIRNETTVSGLVADPANTRVTGVRLGDATIVPCDLLVDAGGRRAPSLAWVTELGYPAPKRDLVEVDIRYVSRTFRRADVPARDWKGAGVVGGPASKRIAMALPLEGERWIVAFGGYHGESAPTDDEGFLAYARSLPSPIIARIVDGSEPLTETVTHRFPASQRRRVEKLRRFPLGWVIAGDAVASFNPLYGQGMTCAAQQAEALGACLDRSRAIDRRFARRFFRAAGRTVNVPWSIAVGGDFAYVGTTGGKPFGTDLLNRYMDRVFVACQYDDAVTIRANEVLAQVRRPESLLAPAFVARVLRSSRRGPRKSLEVEPSPLSSPTVTT